jgi:hypothetical protein
MQNIYRVFPRRLFDFRNLAINATAAAVTLAERIPVSQGTELHFIVRCHRANVTNHGAIAFQLVADYFDPGDPGLLFVQPQTSPIMTALSFGQTAAAGTVLASSYQGGTGSFPLFPFKFVAVQVLGTRASGTAGTAGIDGDFSAEVIVKGPQ